MNDKKWCVYMHINKINNKKYIGITSQNPPERRWRNGGAGYRKGYFSNAIEKYGWDNFKHQILNTNLTFEEAKRLEQEYISEFNSKAPNGYNLTSGGEGVIGWCPDEKFRDRQSKIHLTQWQNENFRNKMTELRRSKDGVYQSKEFRNKISNLVKGEKNPNFGHYWTKEQRENLRTKQQNNPIYKGKNNPNAKRIICVETGEIFDCIKYAKEKYNVKSDGSLTVALKNPNRTAAGLHWVYVK